MNIRGLFVADRAVSPVVGVVLMVGITVTLMAVIATFVLGVSVTSEVPDADFRYEADDGSIDGWGDAGDSAESLHIHHDGGETVRLDNVVVEYAGAPVSGVGWLSVSEPSGDVWKPGETLTITDPNPGSGSATDFASDQQVLVLWENPQGSGTQILADDDLP